MICKNCNSTNFYQLRNNYIKCVKCTKKYSLQKLENDKNIIFGFCQNKTALELSKELNLNYRTVKNRYNKLREKIVIFLDKEYEKTKNNYCEYEEYFFFPKKQKDFNSAIDIIGFYDGKNVFTLYLPKNSNKTFQKIHSLNSYNTKLKEFWNFLEKNIKKYKGIDINNFFYYLKECEFKYNYKTNEQIKLLNTI